MATRRRRRSMSSNTMHLGSTADEGNDSSGALHEVNPVVQTMSNSLRGPQLRSVTRISGVVPLPSTTPSAGPRYATRSSSTASMSCRAPEQLLPVLDSALHFTARPAAAPAEGRMISENRSRDDRSGFSGDQSSAVAQDANRAKSVYLTAPSPTSSTSWWGFGLYPTDIVSGRERTVSLHKSGSLDSGVHDYTCQLSTSTSESRLQSPTLSFHYMLTGSYDVPTLDAILSSTSDGLDQQGRRSHSVHASVLTSALTRQHLKKVDLAAHSGPASSPSALTRLQLAPLLRPKPSIPNHGVGLTRRMPTGPTALSAAAAAAATPTPTPESPKPSRANEDRCAPHPAADARPKEDRRDTSKVQGDAQAKKSDALARATVSASNIKLNGAGTSSLVSVSLRKSPKTTATAQFYSTASLAKTFDGAEYLNDYILLNEIGSGATGRVVLAFSTSMSKSVAIKIIPKPKESHALERRTPRSPSPSAPVPESISRQPNEETGAGTGRAVGTLATKASEAVQVSRSPNSPSGRQGQRRKVRNLHREFDVMKDLNHPNIVRLYEVISDPKANSLFLILQYVDSGAIAQLDSTGHIRAPLQTRTLLPIATQICDGLAYLHEQRIVHRDIKPENILVNRDGRAFLADFGVAELMNVGAGQPTSLTLTYQGTPLFMAPEIYSGDDDDDDECEIGDAPQTPGERTRRRSTSNAGQNSRTTDSRSRQEPRGSRGIDPFALDVWALGVTLYTLLIGHVPFTTMREIRQTMRQGVDIPTALPEQWRTVLRRTMAPQQNSRISSAELCRVLHAMLAEQNAAEVTATGLGRKASRSTRLQNAAHRGCRNTSRESRYANRLGRGACCTIDTEESVNIGASSSSSSVCGMKSSDDDGGSSVSLSHSSDDDDDAVKCNGGDYPTTRV
ncbi:hypothetical protein JKF63_06979 [Porcisia hertigi]|uniref:Protein kinase domain-containing protein n=1 Tax=Porcisia hertigi TaxID=2761500 RepID=A0A836IZ52_9TRYP|nr:hypothetical protein JKF63_06979 [Porcisia hertigi]